jgi:N-acetylglucosamine kinase-like BadF-type ATPase
MSAKAHGRESGLLLGLDGGSAKTAGVIVTSEGRVLAQTRGPASAIIGAPSAEASSVLRSIVDALCSQADVSRDDISSCGVGLSGIDFDDELPVQYPGIAAALGLPEERVILVNDAIVALWGATEAPAATLFQHGSGFTGAYRAQHGREILFDHLGVASCFDMRQEVIRLVARMVNGMAKPTPLKEKILAYFGIEDEEQYCEAIYRGRVASERRRNTPPLVFSAWLEGDPAAADLVNGAIGDYARAAKAMIARTGSLSPDVRFGGGVIAQAPEQFWRSLAAAVKETHPGVTVKPPDLPPEFGGAVMAGHQIGLDPVQLFQGLRVGLQDAREESR